MNKKPEPTYGYCLICPYCLEEDKYSWDLGDGGEGCGDTECGCCGKEFLWERHITVNYTAKPTE